MKSTILISGVCRDVDEIYALLRYYAGSCGTILPRFRDHVSVPSSTLRFSSKNSTFCPHSVFMYSIRIPEQTAIISLYSINWLVSVTETECVYCAVRTVHALFMLNLIFRKRLTKKDTQHCGPLTMQLLTLFQMLNRWLLTLQSKRKRRNRNWTKRTLPPTTIESVVPLITPHPPSLSLTFQG
jgi:hypothetical protein